MKSLFFLLQKTGKVLFGVLFLFGLVIGCSEIETEMLNENPYENLLKSKVLHESTVQLEGFTRFVFYKVVEGEFITDGYTSNFLPCEAELTFEEGQCFILSTKEIMDLGEGPFIFREVTFHGKMTPGGQLKFDWPETWNEFGVPNTMNVVEQIGIHTGLKLSGPGVNKNTISFKGNYNGEKLFADMHLMGLQAQPGVLPLFIDMVKGPVSVHILIDLEVID